MNKALGKIREGIMVEEVLVGELTAELENTERFKELPEEKKGKIVGILEVLKKDTLAHKDALEQIAKKY